MNNIILSRSDIEKDLEAMIMPVPLKEIIQNWKSGKLQFKFHTSGSTGQPKVIHIDRKLILQSALKTIKALQLDSTYTALVCLPLNFIAGFMMVIRALEGGMDIHYIDATGDPIKYLADRKYFAAFVPLQVENILKNESSRNDLLTKILVGGAPMSDKLVARCSKLKGLVYATYGMTETISHVALRRVNGVDPDEYFKLLPDIELAQSDEQTLSIKADVTDHKWIHTNDIVKMYEGGFSVIGRLDNIINSGGIKIIPEALESALSEMDELKQVRFAVSSIQDLKLGEKVVIVIEGHEWDQLMLQNLEDRLSTISKYQKPRAILFLPEFPRTPNGKLKRHDLRQLLLLK